MTPERIKAIMKAANKNPWISGRVAIEDGDPLSALEYQFTKDSISECQTMEELKEKLDNGNWCIGQCFTFRDLVFINQVNGGDEWLTLKFFGDELVSFESITFRPMIHDYKEIEGENFHMYMKDDKIPRERVFEWFIERLLKATKEQCIKHEY